MKCPECGKEISDQAKFCPDCGCLVKNDSVKKEDPKPQRLSDFINEQNALYGNTTPVQQKSAGKPSTLSILALIFSILGCLIITSIVGLILSIIDLTKKDGRRKVLSIIALVLSCIWIAFVLIFAGANTNDESQQVSIQTESATDKENPADTDIQISEPAKETASDSAESKEEFVASDFEEITVIDNDECTVKITGIDPDNLWGYTLNTYLENKSSDKTYMFSVTSAAINGVQCDPLFATEVAAGKKSNNDISFSNNYDIGDFTDIELSFRVYNSDDWMEDSVAEETTHIYPYGKDKATTYVREPQNTDNVIIDNEYVTVIVTGYDPDNIWGYTVNLFLVNKSDKEIMYSVDDVSVNGYMADPFYATSLMPNKCTFSSISWPDTSLEENGISEIEEIEFTFRAHDNNDFMSDDFANKVITLNP